MQPGKKCAREISFLFTSSAALSNSMTVITDHKKKTKFENNFVNQHKNMLRKWVTYIMQYEFFTVTSIYDFVRRCIKHTEFGIIKCKRILKNTTTVKCSGKFLLLSRQKRRRMFVICTRIIMRWWWWVREIIVEKRVVLAKPTVQDTHRRIQYKGNNNKRYFLNRRRRGGRRMTDQKIPSWVLSFVNYARPKGFIVVAVASSCLYCGISLQLPLTT